MILYKPGSFFLTSINPPTGWGIWAGQFLAGRPSQFEHAGVIVSTDGDTVEAEPGGARPGHVSDYDGRHVEVCDGPIWRHMMNNNAWHSTQSVSQVRQDVVDAANSFLKTPYSFLDYAALAALHLHLPSKWIRDRVSESGHLICSQLVDAAYLTAGIHLFRDNRRPGDVMPSDLAKWAHDWNRKLL